MNKDNIDVDQLNRLNQQINDIEKQYPFIVTTVGAVIGAIATIITKTNIPVDDVDKIFEILIIALPIISVLLLCHILNLFRQVALLRGYASYIEECINKEKNKLIVIWNSKYIDGFIENNSPNILLMVTSVIAAISTVAFYLKCLLFKTKIEQIFQWAISITFILFLLIIIYNFAQNDKYRRLSYWKAKNENEKIVRVLLFSECKKIISKSGVGKAQALQIRSLEQNDVYYTTKQNDFYNVVHINTFGLFSYFIAKKCKKKNIKIVISAHTIVEDFSNSFKFTYSQKTQEIFRKWIINFYSIADKIIAPTQYVKYLLQSEKYNISVPIEVISNGVDIELFGENAIKEDEKKEFRNFINQNITKGKKKIRSEDIIIMSVGLFLERKGILNFIKLAELLPRYKFVWFGYTPSIWIPNRISKEINKSRKLNNLYYPGYIDHNLLSKAYRSANLFVHLSYEETEGIVVLEALASKIQILINDIEVYNNWLHDSINCYKVSKALRIDEKAEFDDLTELIDNIILKRKRSTVEEGYLVAKERDLKNIGQELKGLYQDTLLGK